ncbi:hypothetical protein HPB47_004393 [Ixodes persulcatus]|uniref:Uncharacterized protein n=1 Tax=Ixodes persulcatus TaxID=34615 RepID=A0AC60PFT0_IXOPE|nr:hypothetical protein HPB47_004393 [Ixodes persulcatus]
MKPLEPLQVPAKEVDIVTEKASDPQHPNNGQIGDSDRTLNKETDSDEEVEEAWQAAGVVEDNKPDEGPAEDWESEITEPHFVVNKRAYLYGKDVFVPSDIHAVSYRRRTPWYQPVEGQFDDADS